MSNTVRTRLAPLLLIALLLIAAFWLLPAATVPQFAARAQTKVHLPLVFRGWPPVPAVPSLSPIDNGDGDGSYRVSWSSAARADSYELQENYQGQGWLNAYLGTATQVDLTSRPAGTYTYRCRAHNSWGESSWSNEVSVVVQGTPPGTVSRPGCTHVNAGGNSVVRVVNDCPYQLYLDFTGPQPVKMELPKCDVCKVYSFMGPIFCPTSGRPQQDQQLIPGDYRVFVTVSNPSVRPYSGQWTLEGDCRYFVCFYIVTTWSSGEGVQRQLVPGHCN